MDNIMLEKISCEDRAQKIEMQAKLKPKYYPMPIITKKPPGQAVFGEICNKICGRNRTRTPLDLLCVRERQGISTGSTPYIW
jgi:hypothetical protein